MNKCEKCGFLHYRTDPCRKPSKSTAARKDVLGIRWKGKAHTDPQPDGELVSVSRGMVPKLASAGTQALPVDTNPDADAREIGESFSALFAPSAGMGEDKDRRPNPEWYNGIDALPRSEPPPKALMPWPRLAKFDKKAWMREYMREYMRKRRAK